MGLQGYPTITYEVWKLLSSKVSSLEQKYCKILVKLIKITKPTKKVIDLL